MNNPPRPNINWFVISVLLSVSISPIYAYGGSTELLQSLKISLVRIPGGEFVMGDRNGDANEAPQTVKVESFRIMRNEVTNAQFQAFVEDTQFVTDAERSGHGYVWTDRWRIVAHL